LLCGLLLVVSLLSHVPAPGGWEYLSYVAIGAVVVGGWPIAIRAWGSVKHCALDINMLMVLAIAGEGKGEMGKVWTGS
jgi:Cd2+/Zn2+-exporting ATPase